MKKHFILGAAIFALVASTSCSKKSGNDGFEAADEDKVTEQAEEIEEAPKHEPIVEELTQEVVNKLLNAVPAAKLNPEKAKDIFAKDFYYLYDLAHEKCYPVFDVEGWYIDGPIYQARLVEHNVAGEEDREGFVGIYYRLKKANIQSSDESIASVSATYEYATGDGDYIVDQGNDNIWVVLELDEQENGDKLWRIREFNSVREKIYPVVSKAYSYSKLSSEEAAKRYLSENGPTYSDAATIAAALDKGLRPFIKKAEKYYPDGVVRP